ncbi:cob(I)yrinic acid a,c-diamide adenosyltransferase [uncultured Sanguibacteroides sp.]|uniref:cob(I)yrinic acid a,c-diamide adenosyltransferase n=1 Tax=uncultured Sanguibacteroides sp. TaxID=1635151 RepID=UPI0025F36CCA|nr:cob(I)yrinic acid a,c-diamide adenosyltransferase [uncultured Sanguibacteroides sp.]
MKVYTKTGDKGTTSLIGGTRVPKNNVRLEAYGGVDELNAHLGMIRSYPIPAESMEEIVRIQNILFVVGANLATDTTVSDLKQKLPCTSEDIEFLEKAIDRMDEALPPMKFFVLPGGDPAVSACHIARTVCRRVERRILDMSETIEVDEVITRYVNRLSDYLFVLSRKLAHDLHIEEMKWEPKK